MVHRLRAPGGPSPALFPPGAGRGAGAGGVSIRGRGSSRGIQKKNPARNPIEDFMGAANGTLVASLMNAGIPVIQRVVRIPKN